MLIEASVALVKGDVAAADDGLSAFGFRISLLPRFCALAILGLLCDRSLATVGENEWPRDLHEVRGHKARGASPCIIMLPRHHVLKPPAHPWSA
jgi:hypothetical protein